MAIIDRAGACGALAGVLLLGSIAHAVSPRDKCEAAKLTIAGKYDFCRLTEEAKTVKKGGTPDFSKCDPKFSAKWAQAETKGGGSCPTTGDETVLLALITKHTDDIVACLKRCVPVDLRRWYQERDRVL